MCKAQNMSGKVVGHYLLCSLLGCGAAGSVYQAVDTLLDDSPIFAIKCIEKSHDYRRRAQQIAELVNHDTVACCRSVMMLYTSFEDDRYFFLIFPLCEMDLFSAIWKERVFWRNDALIKRAFIDILDGVFACHRKGVFHRDLKPENIMCDSYGRDIRIGDFGLSSGHRICHDGGCGTPYYMSPELLNDDVESYYADSADIWALGIILYNMVTCQFPWEEARLTNKSYMAFMCQKDHLMRKSPISECLSSLFDQIWHPIPLKRLPIPAIRQAILDIDTFYRSRPSSADLPLPAAVALAAIESQDTCVASVEENKEKNPYATLIDTLYDDVPLSPMARKLDKLYI